jgi:hypothetical protein
LHVCQFIRADLILESHTICGFVTIRADYFFACGSVCNFSNIQKDLNTKLFFHTFFLQNSLAPTPNLFMIIYVGQIIGGKTSTSTLPLLHSDSAMMLVLVTQIVLEIGLLTGLKKLFALCRGRV